MKRHFLSACALIVSVVSLAQQSDTAVLSKIRREGFERSQVKSTLTQLSDAYSPRLTGTREYLRAAQWAKTQLEGWGCKSVTFENYCNDCRGWNIKAFNAEMISPSYLHLTAYPLAMSAGTKGIKTAVPVYIQRRHNLDSLYQVYHGKLKGRIVFYGRTATVKPFTEPLSSRMTSEYLASLESREKPLNTQQPLPELVEWFETDGRQNQAFLKFLMDEGVVAMFTTTQSYAGAIHADGTYYYKDNDLKHLPWIALIPEQFNRIVRMIKSNNAPTLRINLDTEFYNEPQNNVNIIAELPGADLKSEVVFIGAHFDTWHSGAGATDNGSGVAVMMEVMRILKASGVVPRRTIRLGLWGGEEQAYVGSVEYAKKHFGSLGGEFTEESRKVSAYLNMDNGAGAMRGIYLQGNENARNAWTALLKAFGDLDVNHVTIENTFGTDHDVFDYYNIPSFQIIQDPLAYYTLTHHTNVDVVDYVPEDDLKRNSVVLAGLVYQLAMANEMVPRKK